MRWLDAVLGRQPRKLHLIYRGSHGRRARSAVDDDGKDSTA